MTVAAMLAMASVSCTKDENTGNGEDTTYTLSLADPLDKEIILTDNEVSTISVNINTNLRADQISVEPKEDQKWCTATLSDDGKTITVILGESAGEKDQTATFIVSATVDGVEPFEFSVTRKVTKYVIESIEGEGLDFKEDQYMPGGYLISYNASASSPASLTITVNTNAPTWYFADSNMAMDPDTYEPIEWYTVDRRSGRDGETITITFKENTSASNRTSMFYFDVVPFEGDYPSSDVSVTVTQDAAPSTYVRLYDADGAEIESRSKVQIGKDGESLDYTIETDFGISSIFANPGTSDPAFDGENDWVTGGQAIWDPTSFSINAQENSTGKERAVDLVITPAGSDTELFRLSIVQAGE